MDEQSSRRKQHSDNLWFWIIIGAYVLFWPAGIALTILKGKNLLPELGGSLQHTLNSARQTAGQTAQRVQQQAAAWTQPEERQKKRRRKRLVFGRGRFVTGVCLGAAGLLTLAGALGQITDLLSYFAHGFFPTGLLAAGLCLAGTGLARMRQSRRLQEYARMLPEGQQAISIHQLADATGRPYRQVCADLSRMTELGIWDDAWIDKKHGRLMLTPYEPEPAAQPAPEQAEDPAEQLLARIRADNALIADPAVSAKIDRIALLTGQIFAYVRQNPESAAQVRTFTDYYLPQTLKILEAYARLEAQGVETENVRKAKAQISAMLDQLADGYERQLDKLMDPQVLDITADIEVMKQMLQKDGLGCDTLEQTLKNQQKRREQL